MKKSKLIKGVGVGAALTGAALGLSGCHFHPKNMEVTDVYGPPIVQDEPETTVQKDFDPADEEIEAVYGPPPEETYETETAEPEDFDPSEMDIEPVYGPPPGDGSTPIDPPEENAP